MRNRVINIIGLLVCLGPALKWLWGIGSLPGDFDGWRLIIKEISSDPWVTLPGIIGVGIIAFANIPKLRFWHASKQVVRLSLMDFLDRARTAKWDIDGHSSLHVIDLAKALRQSGLDNELQFWGKINCGSADATIRNQPLDRVPTDHWRKFEIDTISWKESKDNFYSRTYSPSLDGWGKERSYHDLHVDEAESIKWLKNHPAPPPTPPKDISLVEAARIAYEETRRTAVIAVMEHVVKDPEKMLGFMATQLIKEGALRVFGCFPPSTVSERIPDEDACSFRVSDDATELIDYFNEKRRYTNLTVRREEFRRRLDHLKSTKWTSRDLLQEALNTEN